MSRQTANYPIPSSYKSHFIVASKYKLVRKIGSGSFGDIYLGKSSCKKVIKKFMIIRNLRIVRSELDFSFHSVLVGFGPPIPDHNIRDEHIEWGGGGNQA